MSQFSVDNVWGMIGLIATSVVTGWFGYLTMKAKAGSDKKDEDIQPVLEKVEATANLQPVVAELVRQMSVVQKELEEYRPIAKVKYPLALNTINVYRFFHPDSPVEIPDQIFDDL